MDKPLVSISCITYNHEKYIRDCLDGFMMQKTDFPFEILIHDDASTDRTADIIREYEKNFPNIIKPIYQTENQFSKGLMIGETFNFPRAQGDYIAICEGDDYWNSPDKLQKQIDMFRARPELAMVYCDYDIRNEIAGRQVHSIIENHSSPEIRSHAGCLTLEEVVAGKCRIATASCVCKRNVFLEPCAPLDKFRGLALSDLFFKIDAMIYGGIGYIPEAMTTYRMVSGSATHTGSAAKAMKFEWDALKIREYYCDHCRVADEVAREIHESAFRRMARIALSLYSPEDVRKIKTLADKYAINFSASQKFMLCCGRSRIFGGMIRGSVAFLKWLREQNRKCGARHRKER